MTKTVHVLAVLGGPHDGRTVKRSFPAAKDPAGLLVSLKDELHFVNDETQYRLRRERGCLLAVHPDAVRLFD